MKLKPQRFAIAIMTIGVIIVQGMMPSLVAYAQPARTSQEGGALPLPDGKAGQSYEYQLRTEGGLSPLTWRVVGGELPLGISLEPSGKLKGVPTIPRIGAYSFVIEVSDSSPTPQRFAQSFLLMIQAAPLRIVNATPSLRIVAPSKTASTSPFAPPASESTSSSSRGREGTVRVAGERVSNDGSSVEGSSSEAPRAGTKSRTVSSAADEPTADDPLPAPAFRKPVEGATHIVGKAAPGAAVTIFVRARPGNVDENKDVAATATADDKGDFDAELVNPLLKDYYVSARQGPNGVISSAQIVAAALYDWGRVRAYFAANVVFSKERDEFSQQDLGISFNLDKNWVWGKTLNFNTYFEASLTAIPVKAKEGDPAPTDPPPPPPTETPGEAFLASKKAAVLQGGAYLPWSAHSWIWSFDGKDNALFVAPIAKAGFQTITNGQVTAEADVFGKDDVFSFFSAGIRLGHFKLSDSPSIAHELISYLDITPGKWENFEVVDTNGKRDNRMRVGIEGRLKIPATPLLVGFDANLGKGKDDLRFVFGTRFDIGELLGKLKFLQQR